MVKSLRLRLMEDFILEKGVASMDELCSKYEISMNTLRNDISELAEKGTIKKVYGGVCSNVGGNSSTLVSFEERSQQNVSSKREIARAAAEFVEDGDIIYIDSGTTNMNMVDFFEGKRNITVITHSLDVINKAYHNPEIDIFCIGGKLQRSTNCFTGTPVSDMMKRYNICKAFMGTKGITEDGSITDSSMSEYDVKRWALERSAKSILLVDSSKFLRTGLMSYAHLSDISMVITDRLVQDGFINLCEKMKTSYKIV